MEWPKDGKEAWCEELEARLSRKSPPSVRYELGVVKGEEGHELLLSRVTHGVREDRIINGEFFGGPEYRLIAKVADALYGLIQVGAIVRRGKSEQAVESFREAYEWLMAESRKGRSIQRS